MALEKVLKDWLVRHHFDVVIDFGDDFSYNTDYHILTFGTKSYPDVGRYFEQFLYEYGMEYTGIFDEVLCMLHELGHYMTIDNFDEGERVECFLFKHLIRGEDFEWFEGYWSVSDEFAANMWVVNYVNENIEAVEELCNLLLKENYYAV